MAQTRRRNVTTQLDAAADECARQGAQLTELRRTVLRLVLEADNPATAYQLLDRLKETRKGAAPPTIYRALDFLMERGLIHKIERLNAFVPCNESGHVHHAAQFLICRKCGSVAELDDPEVSKALEKAAHRQSFHTASAVVELDGTCADCAHAA
jgi:Fur family transcriptional regulator, zinc uptake regulator